MTISDTGLNRIVTLITADLDDGRAGTGDTTSTSSDTDLETPVVDTEVDVDIVTVDKGFSVTHLINSTSGNGSNLTEWQIRMNSEATQLHRVVTAAVAKSAIIEVTKITLFDLVGE